MPRLRALPAAFSVVILSGCGDTATSQVQASSTFLVRDVRVFDGERVAEHRNVLVRGGLIDGIGGLELSPPPDAEIIEYVLDIQEVKVLGDHAFQWGTYHYSLRPRTSVETVRTAGKIMRILQRQPDGSWKVYRGIATIDPPSP